MVASSASIDGWNFMRFTSISIAFQSYHNETLCAVEQRLRLKRSPPEAELESGTAKSLGKEVTY